MKRVTYTAILARAISDCNASIRDAAATMRAFAQKQATTEAAFYYDNIVRPIEEELTTLKTLYEIETGAPYEIDPAD